MEHVSESDDGSCSSAGFVSSTKRHGVAKPPYMLPWKTTLTDEQRSDVEERLGAIRSEIPAYVAVMKNSNVDSRRMCTLVSHHFSIFFRARLGAYFIKQNAVLYTSKKQRKLAFHLPKVYSC